jgi:hypothetical protein
MIDIITFLPSKRKQTASGWISFNAPCCIHNGDSQDRRMRGGIKTNYDGWSYHCFNCNFTASFVLGRNLSIKARKLLTWLNVPQKEIDHINLESMKYRSIEGLIHDRKQTSDALLGIQFQELKLPPSSVLLDTEKHATHLDYLKSRHIPIDYPFLFREENDGVHWTRPHIIIPFTYDNIIVGHTNRFLDNKLPKYINVMQPGYVFGADLQKSNWQYSIVVEGVFDALSINGLAVMHSTINDAQVRLIRNLGKEIIVVPDQDLAGMELLDRAVELGWAVSIPDWPEDVKDVNDAVIKLGKIATLLTILHAKETSKIKIELRKRQLVKRLRN